MQLSKKQKSFSQFFSAFLEFRLNCEHFKKKENPHRLWILDITGCERGI